jgi:bacterioferritin (cytochrome b1)
VQEIVDTVGQKKVAVIADTIQNGENVGEALAKKLGVEKVVLSSYPGAAKYTTNWEDTIARNMTLILATISNCPYC